MSKSSNDFLNEQMANGADAFRAAREHEFDMLQYMEGDTIGLRTPELEPAHLAQLLTPQD